MRRPAILLALVVSSVAIGAAACGEKAPPPPPRTPEQQRKVDSTIGASKLPGAPGVQGALRAQDSAKARQAQLDSLSKAP